MLSVNVFGPPDIYCLAARLHLTRQRISDEDEDDENDDTEDMEDIANFETELAQGEDTAADAAKSFAPKAKRGRKMTMTTKDTDAMCTTIEETTIVNDSAEATQSAKKKKRGRKSGTTKTPDDTNSKDATKNHATTSTSDEDEECSALNCIRPTGNVCT